MITYFTIYQITHIDSGKIYIGMHQTDDIYDKYMGSGTAIIRAQKKHGRDRFIKEILFVFDTIDDMIDKERKLVTEEFVKRSDTYNLIEGGPANTTYINRRGINNRGKDMEAIGKKISNALSGRPQLPHVRDALRQAHKDGKINYATFTGKTHTQETKDRIGRTNAINQAGTGNSQFGTRWKWITDGQGVRKIPLSVATPVGWWRRIVQIPRLGPIEMCVGCRQYNKDIYWWKQFQESDMGVSQFVREIYPHNRANFYVMKKRLGYA